MTRHMHLVLDIETKADREFLSREDVEEVLLRMARTGNAKAADKVEQKREEFLAKRMAQGALSPVTGHVVAIGFVDMHDMGAQPTVFADTNPFHEHDILRQFADWLFDEKIDPIVVGWRVRSFDLPFLNARFAAHDIVTPASWPEPRDRHRVFDLGEELDYEHKDCLDLWLLRNGIERKTAHGSDVEKMTTDEVSAYCAADVVREAKLARRFEKRYRMLASTYTPYRSTKEVSL